MDEPATPDTGSETAESSNRTRRPSIAVVGGGILGAGIARNLLTPVSDPWPKPSRLVLVTRRPERAAQLRASFGRDVRVVEDTNDSWVPGDDTDVVVLARGYDEQEALARSCITSGTNVVTTTDDLGAVRNLLELDGEAEAHGVALVLGATMAPGLSCLLAKHGSELFDRVDEIHVGRLGAAGPACARSRLKALRGTAVEWRGGRFQDRAGFSGRELSWFPDPIGGRDAYRAALPSPLLLVPQFPGVERVTARLVANRRDRALAPFPVLVPPPEEGGLGAIRVELRGEKNGERLGVVYGALDRPSVAASTVAAVAALWIGRGVGVTGAVGLAGVGGTLEILTELSRRGIRAASFEGGAIRATTKR